MPSADALVLQRPATPASQLILLFHGLGATPDDLAPLGEFLAGHFPQAFIVSVPGHEDCDFGGGRQWFSVRDITEADRPQRIDAAMPAFVATVRHWQQAAGLGVEPTALLGFSQGAMMVLAATQRDAPALAGRVISIAGRFAEPPQRPALETTFHLFHGRQDAVIPYAQTVSAAERLLALGADVTADVLPFIGHTIDDEIAQRLLQRLTTYVPRRVWQAAMAAAAAAGEDGSDAKGGDAVT
jgi:phospholipase/carboxylesterase